MFEKASVPSVREAVDVFYTDQPDAGSGEKSSVKMCVCIRFIIETQDSKTVQYCIGKWKNSRLIAERPKKNGAVAVQHAPG